MPRGGGAVVDEVSIDEHGTVVGAAADSSGGEGC